jgi:DEAD/DEAH box helicase domain-containing protein
MEVLEQLRADQAFMHSVAVWERLPARPARHGDTPQDLDNHIVAALKAQELYPLYTHQAEAVNAALAGENIVVVTGTASGKTLCYNLPVLHSLLADSEARALYLFPTKALAQDQAEALGQFLDGLSGGPEIHVRTYDGDTPQKLRREIRDDARVLISNPDMLHMGILPYHPRWALMFQNLQWIIIDELHVYRGVFGSNVANLLRRLKRICAFYGSKPKFILTSATIANPKELAERLTEETVRLIPVDLDGSPRAEKHVLIYNPPLINPELGIRRAYTLESTRIAQRFLKAEVQTVVFARARLTTEVLLGYIRDTVQSEGGDPDAIRGYRGGYLPLERREIERGLREGLVKGVVATTALELGVDIGQLGAAVIAGYPGTIASLWQQIGRAGRRSAVSAAVLVASGAPLDQFVATHPRYLFENPPEHGLINPNNSALLERHVRCATFELPFEQDEAFGRNVLIRPVLEQLEEQGDLHRSNGVFRWIADSYPAEKVSLRSGAANTVVIQRLGEGKPVVIGEVDLVAAPILLHEGAVYTHEGRTHIVKRLDWDGALAEVQAVEVDYYTNASESVDLEVLDVRDANERAAARKAHGRVKLVAEATTYRKVKRYTHETLGYGQIKLPPRIYETTAYWLWIAPETVAELEEEGVLTAPPNYGPSWKESRDAALERDGFVCRQCGAPQRLDRNHDVHHLRPFRDFGYQAGENRRDQEANELENLITLCSACHHRAEAARGTRTALAGLAHALHSIAPLFLMCDPRDLGGVTELRSKETGSPTITIYDRLPEGLGFSERLFELQDQLLRGVLEMVRTCRCSDGCPACVGPVGIGGQEVKDLTVQLAEALLGT